MSKRFDVLQDNKQRELIAAVDTSFFTTSPVFRGSEDLTAEEKARPFIASIDLDWLHEARGQIIFGERRSLEGNDKWRQLLPYVIVRCPDGPEASYLLYQRVKHTNETKLAGNTSIGLGGHIDLTDVVVFEDTAGIVDWESVITLNIRRELSEETGVVETFAMCETNSLGVILDDSDDNKGVGKVHVGIVQIIDVPWEVVEQMKVNMDTDDAEARLIDFLTVTQLREYQEANGNMEPWTRILLDSGIL